MGVYDPPYPGGCASDATAPTCSVFVPETTYIQRACTSPWYPADFTPPPADSAEWCPVYTGVLPDDLESSPSSCDLYYMRWWIHQASITATPRTVNIRLEYSDPGSPTLIVREVHSPVGNWTGPFSYSAGAFIATTATPIQVRVGVQGLWIGTPDVGTQAFEWGAAIWSDESCLTATTIPARLATIVG
jgi:hypothetical protein